MSLSICTHCNGTGRKNLRFVDSSPMICNPNDHCVSCTKIANIQKRIDAARCVLDELLEEKESTATAFNAEHDQLCRKLPNELVSEVFFHTLPLSPSTTIFEGLQKNDPKISLHNRTLQHLDGVCRRWRTVARRTPKLWAVLATTFQSHSNTLDHTGFEAWLELSGQLPLYLRLRFPCHDRVSRRFQIDHLTTVTSSLLPHIARIVVLDIQAPSSALTRFLSSCPSLHLQHLNIIVTTDIRLNLMTAPNILTMRNGMAEISFSDWSNLNNIFVGYLSEAKLLHILQNASNLSTCKVGKFKGESLGLRSLVIVHEALEILDIFNMSNILWDQLCFPNLRNLILRNGISSGVDCITSVIDFLSRSKCQLRSLQCCSITSEHNIIQLLTHTPTLLHLSIHQTSLSDFFFHRLTLSSSSELLGNSAPLIEKLECFKYELLDATRFDWPVLVPFLKSRSSGEGGSLCSLQIDISIDDTSVSDDFESEEGSYMMDKDIADPILTAANGVDLAIINNGATILKKARQRSSLE